MRRVTRRRPRCACAISKRNQERWLINNVTRDDQESRATRDTFPGYDFMPDGKSLIVPINGKIARVDFATGQATDIPFTANVEAEIGPRVLFRVPRRRRPEGQRRLIRYPAISPDGKRAAFTAFQQALRHGPAGGNAADALTNWHRRRIYADVVA